MKTTLVLGIAAMTILSACSDRGYYSSPAMRGTAYEQENAYDDRDDHGGMVDKKVNAITNRLFSEADVNRDGYLSWKEFDAFLHRKFREADSNHDKLLSRGEVKIMKRQEMKSMHQQLREEKASEMRSDESMNSEAVSPGMGSDNVYKDNNRY